MINIILSSPEIIIMGAAMLKDSLGDQCMLIVNFEEDSLIGENLYVASPKFATGIMLLLPRPSAITKCWTNSAQSRQSNLPTNPSPRTCQ
jgi:hypothetical protein